MNRSPFVLSAVLAVLFAAAPLSTVAQTAAPAALTPEQREVIRDRLTGMLNTLKTVTEEKNSNLTGLFMRAAETQRTALEFYLDSVKDIDFARDGKDESDFREWKNNPRNERLLDDDDFARALQILLRYLAISTEAARTDDMEKIFGLLSQYIDGVASMQDEPHGSLDNPIYDSVFARRFELFEDLKKKDRQDEEARDETGDEKKRKIADWEARPLNVGGMYEKVILPYLHENSPDKVPGAWLKRIDQQARIAVVRGDTYEARFRRVNLPRLQWDMYVDQFKAGYEVDGAAKMLEHIEKHKDTHPKANDWIEEMIAVIFTETDSTFKKDPVATEKEPNPLEGIKLGE